jgi:hypothetical protein
LASFYIHVCVHRLLDGQLLNIREHV